MNVRRLFIIGLLLASCCIRVHAQAQPSRVTQYATIDALLAGAYDGIVPLGEVLQEGNLGLGTVDHLDGELVILDGVAYQVTLDGKVHTPGPEMTTPFAVVCPFEGEERIPLEEPLNFTQFKAALDKTAPDTTVFAAFRLDGQFRAVRTRSVPAQEKPYRPLAEVVKEQAVFEMKDVRGTVLGIRCPSYMTGVNVPGYHFHFLSEDRQRGGHVLGFELVTGMCAIDYFDELLLRLPKVAGILDGAGMTKDRMQHLIDVIEK